MARFRLTSAARASLVSIGRYTETTHGRRQRDQYLEALDARFHALAAAPMHGIARDDLAEGLRSFPEGKHVIFYVLRNQEIVIVDVLHERMEPARHLPGDLEPEDKP